MLMTSTTHSDTSVIDALERESPLRARMLRCGTPSQYCGRVGCLVCRNRYVRHQIAKTALRFAGVGAAEFANARITIGATNHVGDIGPMFDTARTKLRNIIDQQRAARTIWHGVEVLGWMRVAATAGQLAQKPTWMISANIVVRHGALPYQEFGHMLAEGWKSPGQTAVTPFNPATPIHESLGESIQRVLAPWRPTADAAWPKDWVRELYEYVEGWSRSFQSLRIDIGPRDAKLTRHTPYVTDSWIEPMPVIIGNDGFSTIGYPWN